jgi:hypothetical protein
MNTKTLLAVYCLLFALPRLRAQNNPSLASESLYIGDLKTTAQLELHCADCRAITEVWLKGDGVCYTASYQGDGWKSVFPKKVPVVSGDYTLRVKLNGTTWKTLHLYVKKNEDQKLMLN